MAQLALRSLVQATRYSRSIAFSNPEPSLASRRGTLTTLPLPGSQEVPKLPLSGHYHLQQMPTLGDSTSLALRHAMGSPGCCLKVKDGGHRDLVEGHLGRGCRAQKRSTRTSPGSWVSTWNGTPVLLNESHYRRGYTLAITFSLSDIKGRSSINK